MRGQRCRRAVAGRAHGRHQAAEGIESGNLPGVPSDAQRRGPLQGVIPALLQLGQSQARCSARPATWASKIARRDLAAAGPSWPRLCRRPPSSEAEAARNRSAAQSLTISTGRGASPIASRPQFRFALCLRPFAPQECKPLGAIMFRACSHPYTVSPVRAGETRRSEGFARL